MAVHVPSSGWAAWVVHPDTGRVMHADVLSEPTIDPSLNSLPNISIPVPKSQQWQDLDGRPELNVYLDGEEQPIDELTRPVDAKGSATTELAGRGGVELLARVQEEYDVQRRHVAAENLITDHTTYDADVPAPSFDVLTDQTMQSPASASDFSDLLPIADTTPLVVSGNDVTTQQTCFTVEAEDFDRESGDSLNVTGQDDYSDGAGERFRGQAATREYDFTPAYDIPAGDFDVFIRNEGTATPPTVNILINGADISETTIAAGWDPLLAFSWDPASDFDNAGNLDDLALSGGTTYTVTLEDAGNGESGTRSFDVVAPRDTRFSYTDDNTLNQNQGWLDGPETHPDAVDAVFDPATSAFVVQAASVTATLDDTGNSQRIQLSNNLGQDWFPADGTEDNTTSVTVDPFTTLGSTVRTRVTLSRHSPSGTRDQTPREGYDGQTLSDYTITADLRQESLLIDESKDDTLESILTDIVGSEYLWAYRVVDGTPTVTVVQPGAREGDDPSLVEATVEKDIETYHKITVKGANKRVSDERFTAGGSFVALNNTFVTPGSETVRDPTTGENFSRGTDYEVNWQDGEVRAVASGTLDSGTEYAIDYRHEVSGSYEDPDAPANFRERVVDIPGVTSERNATQIAYVLVAVDEFNQPRYSADILVPPGVAQFDAVSALPLDSLDLPDGVGALEVEEPPQVTPEGTALRLGTRPELETRLSELRGRVQSLSRRTG